MKKKRAYTFLFGLVLIIGLTVPAFAAGPIELLQDEGEINKLKFVTYQNFTDSDKNGLDEGDWFEGIFKAQSISNISGTKELTAQLSDVELTGHFKFSVAGVSAGHADLVLGATDFMRFYAGTGTDMNWDPAADDAITRATDGKSWLSIEPPAFFEGVSDSFSTSYSFTESWANVSLNNTGYTILPQIYPTIFDPIYPGHINMGTVHTDHPSDVYFQSLASGSNILPKWNIRSEDIMYMAVAPEPLSSMLFLAGSTVLGFRVYRRRKV